MKRLTRTALLLLSFAACALTCLAQANSSGAAAAEANPKSWVSFTSAEGGFEVRMPGRPTEETEIISASGVDVVMHAFTVRTMAEYGVMYADYPWTVEGTERVKPFFEGVRDTGVRGVGGKLLDYKEQEFRGHPGRVYRVEFGGGYQIRTMAFVVKNRLYMVTATTYGAKAPSQEFTRLYERAADTFIDSFRLTSGDEAGVVDLDPVIPKATATGPPSEGEVDRLLKDKSVGVVIGEGGADSQPQSPSAPKHTIEGGVLSARETYKPEPEYPPIAKAARAQGAVRVKVIVGEDGSVIAAQAESGHPLLLAAAVKAARQARFSPTLLDGKPVKVLGVITYNFALK